MVSCAALMPYAPSEDDSMIDTRLLQHIKERLLISIMTGDGVAAAAGRRDAAAEAAVQDDHVPHRRGGRRHDGGLPPGRGALGAAPEVSTDSTCLVRPRVCSLKDGESGRSKEVPRPDARLVLSNSHVCGFGFSPIL